jgi:hypothetical protein
MGTASHPRIQSLRARAVRVPVREPHQTASGAVTESPLVLTDVTIDDGTVGHSVVFTAIWFSPGSARVNANLLFPSGAAAG